MSQADLERSYGEYPAYRYSDFTVPHDVARTGVSHPVQPPDVVVSHTSSGCDCDPELSSMTSNRLPMLPSYRVQPSFLYLYSTTGGVPAGNGHGNGHSHGGNGHGPELHALGDGRGAAGGHP